MNHQSQKHLPVLAQEVLSILDPHAEEHYLDLTAGYGGHARSVLERIGKQGKAVLVDRDQNATEHLNGQFNKDKRVEVVHSDFYQASQDLLDKGQRFDLVLADIGLSSPHIDNAERGFSFQQSGPLDMRMDPRQSLTADKIVNQWPFENLADILRKYGEIRRANKIAHAIIEARPIETTTQLAAVIKKSAKASFKAKPEAQVFQALRIAVNDELTQLKNSLPLWHKLLKPGGRLAVITFHSLEDRIVKQYFQEHGGNRYDADLKILTPKPVTSTKLESFSNPRARSAKLRATQRK